MVCCEPAVDAPQKRLFGLWTLEMLCPQARVLVVSVSSPRFTCIAAISPIYRRLGFALVASRWWLFLTGWA
jgi:hypothetical protein